MKKNLAVINQEFREVVSTFFVAEISARINEHIRFLSSVINIADNLLIEINKLPEDSIAILKLLILSGSEITNVIKVRNKENIKINFDEDFNQYVAAANNLINQLEEVRLLVQNSGRFSPSVEDSYKIKTFKRIKKTTFSISQLPVNISNYFRSTFNKIPKPQKRWHHSVPMKRLTAFYFRDRLSTALIPLIEEMNSNLLETALKTFQIQAEFVKDILNSIDNTSGIKLSSSNQAKLYSDFQKTQNSLIELKTELNIRALGALKKTFSDFEDAYEKSGTIELPARIYKESRIQKKHNDLNKEYERLNYEWGNAHYALYDHWSLTFEAYTTKSKALERYLMLTKLISHSFRNELVPRINSVLQFLDETEKNIDALLDDTGLLRTTLLSKKESIYINLTNTIIPDVTESILSQNFPSLVDELEIAMTKIVGDLSIKRAVVKTDSYNVPLKSSEVDFINPKELITFDSLPRFVNASYKIKNEIIYLVEKTQKDLLEVDQIADFNIESAISALESQNFTDAKKIAIDGIKRALVKVNELQFELEKIKGIIKDKLGNAIAGFNNDILQLTSTEKILHIKIKIAKAKAIERTKAFKEKVFHFIKRILPVIISNFKLLFQKFIDSYHGIKNRFGLIPKSSVISTEISDFLAETHRSIEKLPYVYQRLFIIEALYDERFYIEREKELIQFNKAFQNWTKGYFSSTAIVGEKGAGATTTINMFLKKIDSKYRIRRISISVTLYEEEKFLSFLSSLFEVNPFTSIDDVIHHVNRLNTKEIIIIENIQQIFLKTVGGFNCLKLLFELISQTNQNVFWIFTSTLYAWEYLNKTINIADHFGYIIKLDLLKNEQIIDIILKRHRVSGFKIIFEPSSEDLVSRSFNKLPDNGKQLFLRKEYFSDLNKFARSNISLALTFWLRSTKEVTEDSITISSLKNLDFSFLSSISTTKLFTLYAMLLHDGITEESYSAIFNISNSQSKLLLAVLLDDGVVIKKNEFYMLNPLLYRHTVNLLQSKNIIN